MIIIIVILLSCIISLAIIYYYYSKIRNELKIIDTPITNNQIRYRTVDSKKLFPTSYNFGKGVNLVRNIYNKNRNMGVLIFDKDVTEIGEKAFEGGLFNSSRLLEIILPNSINKIGDRAFDGCGRLNNINIPNEVESIGYSAFSRCGLTHINIPKSVTVIKGSFADNKGLRHFEGPYATKDHRCIVIKGHLVAFAPYKLSEYTIPADAGVKVIDYDAFNSKELLKVVIPEGVETIKFAAFLDSYYLREVTIPSSVKTIENMAFYVEALNKINIPDDSSIDLSMILGNDSDNDDDDDDDEIDEIDEIDEFDEFDEFEV